jgi:hypothetical protein
VVDQQAPLPFIRLIEVTAKIKEGRLEARKIPSIVPSDSGSTPEVSGMFDNCWGSLARLGRNFLRAGRPPTNSGGEHAEAQREPPS